MYFTGYSKKMTYEDLLRKHKLEETSIEVLIRNGITSAEILLALDNDDVQAFDLNIGQAALLKKLIKKLKASAEEDQEPPGGGKKEWHQDEAKQQYDRNEDKHRDHTSHSETNEQAENMRKDKASSEDLLENMDEANFWCLFKCLGGIGAVGLGGILALVALVTYGLPVIGFGAAGIAGGSLAAKIMALYGGSVASGSLVATLQSVAAAGIGWKAILTTLFGGSAVMTAVQGACSHCFK